MLNRRSGSLVLHSTSSASTRSILLVIITTSWLLHQLLLLHALMGQLENLLKNLGHSRGVGDVVVADVDSLHLLQELLEVGSVSSDEVLDLSQLLDLVLLNLKSLAIEDLSMKLQFSLRSLTGLLVANKGLMRNISVLVLNQLNVLNFSVFLEDISDLLLLPVIRESSDQQVASLLGLLQTQDLLHSLNLPLMCWLSIVHKHLLISELLSIHLSHCFLGTF